MRPIFQLLTVFLLAATPAVANAAQPVAKAPVNALELTCGDLMRAMRVADPGKAPSRLRLQQAREAQDDIAMGLHWIHGYRTAKLGSAAPALTPQWLGQELKSVAAACRKRSPDGTMTLFEIVRS